MPVGHQQQGALAAVLQQSSSTGTMQEGGPGLHSILAAGLMASSLGPGMYGSLWV